jgi:hypothetical protein
MTRGGEDIHAPYGDPDSLVPWTKGTPGKFLIDGSGNFHAWRTREDRAPHHAAAAERLGVSSWPLDGIVTPDGTFEPTAKMPGIDAETMIADALPQAEALGMRFRQ